MSKSSSPSATPDPIEATVDRLRAAVEDEVGTPDPNTALGAQYTFWTRLRPLLAANAESSGLDALDDLALAVMADDPALPATIGKVIILLPPPETQQPSQPPVHRFLQPSPAPGRASKRPVTRSSLLAKPKSLKKRKTSGKAPLQTSTFKFDLPDGTPDRIRKDLVGLVKSAAAVGKAPFREAYPWRGQRVWYDPKEFTALHLAHYRFWMKFRRIFYDCALYAPTDKSDARRKHKTQANQARLKFVSDNIETFGCYEFMRRFEDELHDTMMWVGGKAAKHSADAKNNHESPQEDLVTLYRRDRPRYDRVIARMSDPQRVDEDGYSSIPKLLVRTNALDPTRSPHLRLSSGALARIALDVTQGPPTNPSWVGNKSRGVWKTLLTNKTLRSTQAEVAKLFAKKKPISNLTEKPYKITEKGADDSDLEDDDDGAEDEADSEHTGLTDDSDEDDKKGKADDDSEYVPDAADDGDDQDEDEADEVDTDSKAGGDRADEKSEPDDDKEPSPPKSPKSK